MPEHGGLSLLRKSGLSARILPLLVGSALCLLPAIGRAAVLLNENFDELTPTLSATDVGLFHTLGGTNVDIVGGSTYGYLCVSPESGNCVDMGGSGGNPQGVLQSKTAITLHPGTTYLLSFDLIGSQRGVTASTTVTFGPYDQTFSLASGDVTSGIVSDAPITVASTTVAYLTFTSDTPGNVGDLLDDVLVTSATIPEPAPLALFGVALIGLGLARGRKHA